jgi:hypothetical protein
VTWFKVDDQLAIHPKAILAGNAAMGLWVRAGSWCAAHLTGGALPAHMLGTLGAQRRDARRLVDAGLWTRTNAGYQFKDWQDWQPTKAEVEADKEANRARQKRWRDRQRNAVTNGVTDTVTNGVSNGTPSRPVPTVLPTEVQEPPSSLRSEPPRPKSKRGSRLPEGWTPNPKLVEEMEAECPGVDLRSEHRSFTDHWKSQPGSKALKLDWDATWRNWMRRARTSRGPNLRAAPRSTTDDRMAAVQQLRSTPRTSPFPELRAIE